MPAPMAPEEIAARVDRIRRVALQLFAERGYEATPMAAIAEAAGLSRPALYQHFESREDVFRSALEQLLTDANERALAELRRDGTTADRFDGYLQRCRGDVIGPLLASTHGAELLETRRSTASGVADGLHTERRTGLETYLRDAGLDRSAIRQVVDLLELAPLGLKHDQPTVRVYRKRLTSLAEAAASMVG